MSMKKGHKLLPFTEEHKKNMSNSRKGKPSSRKGAILSDETKKKISDAKIGKPSPRKGVTLSEETKQKLRNANLGKKLLEETKSKIGYSQKGRAAWNKGKKYRSPKQSIAMAGNKNSNWKGGISFELYSNNWTDDLKDSIRKRDNYTCALCGLHQDELLDGYIKVLDIHHIDYDKNNLNPTNLITLCRSCHMKTNYNRDYWQNNLEKHDK